MHNEKIKKILTEKSVQGNLVYHAQADQTKGDSINIRQGYVVDDYFIDEKTEEIFNKEEFDMIVNLDTED
ncbi:MAG: hypothetical protein IJ870_03985 [Alphaproteobacteria bacterium]|nr:hypothetical protein [Alphaproteobacteria bacterium]